MPDDPPVCLLAGLEYIARGWPAFVCKPQSKEPLTRHGVNDATLDAAQLERWFAKWPQANIAIACGSPGPQVLDVDDPRAGHVALVRVSRLGGPDVATARGRQFYLRGLDRGTVGLGWGELRGQGSYVIAPPSLHPSGKVYVFLIAPAETPLPPVPDDIVPEGITTAGVGDFRAPELIAYGQRHDALKDAAVRFVRAGITDVQTLEQMLRSFFEARFVPKPKPRADEFLNLAAWAARSRMAARERQYADFDDLKPPTKKKGIGLAPPPPPPAPLKEHRDYVRIAGGWGDRIDIVAVHRFGAGPADALEIHLSNGQRIYFARQEHVATRAVWARIVALATNGIANPVSLKDVEGVKVLRSLCILADAPAYIAEAQNIADAVDNFVAHAEDVNAHDLTTQDGRYNAIEHCRARTPWDPRRADEEHRPILLVCRGGSGRYVRAGELRDYLRVHDFAIASDALAGRVAMAGLEYRLLAGREPRQADRVGRKTARGVFFRLPDASQDDEG
jgi:hypothetical protein